MVVVGGGTAGLVTAAITAALGGRVALVERDLLGGDCLNVGCVPSKALLRSARAVADVRQADRFGVRVGEPVSVDFAAVMERLRRLRAGIAPHDSAERFRNLGVDVYLGHGRFKSPDTLRVDGRDLRFARACIATGARASAPDIPGLAEAGFLTNETVFSLTVLPPRLAVIGAGPIGCELAQAFARLGSQVWLIETEHGILPREDAEASAIVQVQMERDGVRIRCCGRDLRVEKGRDGTHVMLSSHGRVHDLAVDRILVAAGRAPNVVDLGLEQAGVAYDTSAGVKVDDRLRTTNRRIYAAGDVCSAYRFTHAADFMARIAAQNALFLGRRRLSALTIPWCTYTDPEVAHVGLTAAEAAERGVRSLVIPMSEVDRAVLDDEEQGLLKVHLRDSGAILGATLVARHAGDMIGEMALAMSSGSGLGTLGRTIHPYPTQAEIFRKAGDAWGRGRLKPWVRALTERWLRFRR
jgi:pyruvate/2-oxoglutarate dehydrogenase complex dihydrolipoamide dehydrogenase (E3) component